MRLGFESQEFRTHREKMHCDDKRTIFALKQSLNEAITEKKGLILKLEIEKNMQKRIEIENKLKILNKFIDDLNYQISNL